jgi:hypothetical protein
MASRRLAVFFSRNGNTVLDCSPGVQPSRKNECPAGQKRDMSLPFSIGLRRGQPAKTIFLAFLDEQSDPVSSAQLGNANRIPRWAQFGTHGRPESVPGPAWGRSDDRYLQESLTIFTAVTFK